MTDARYSWSRLNGLQVGRYAEYFMKMEFALYGFDIYSAEVDDKGIDFVVRHERGCFHEIQVKSARKTSYVFMPKDKFPLVPERWLALVLLTEGRLPDPYLISATEWNQPNPLLVDRDYREGKSKPEYGVQLSSKTRPLLQPYRFDQQVNVLRARGVDVGPDQDGRLTMQ